MRAQRVWRCVCDVSMQAAVLLPCRSLAFGCRVQLRGLHHNLITRTLVLPKSRSCRLRSIFSSTSTLPSEEASLRGLSPSFVSDSVLWPNYSHTFFRAAQGNTSRRADKTDMTRRYLWEILEICIGLFQAAGPDVYQASQYLVSGTNFDLTPRSLPAAGLAAHA